ncbi:hypothetical protein OC834_006090 [Tilletia horrida]|nr:hypothetical protein OC834_006090 [Tilletia horrida]
MSLSVFPPAYSASQPPSNEAMPGQRVRELLSAEAFAQGGTVLGNRLIQVLKLHLEQFEAYNLRQLEVVLPKPADNAAAPSYELHALHHPEDAVSLVSAAAERIAGQLDLNTQPQELHRVVLDQTSRNQFWACRALQDALLKRPHLPYYLLAPAIDLHAKIQTEQAAPAVLSSAVAEPMQDDSTDTEMSTTDDESVRSRQPSPTPSQSTITGLETELDAARVAHLDDWILDNEHFMRARLVLDDPVHRPTINAVLRQLRLHDEDGVREEDFATSHWQRFLLALGRDGQHAFGESAVSSDPNSWTVRRPSPEEVAGVTMLDQYRREHVRINRLPSFMSHFQRLTNGILDGLDWSNIFLAGGAALGALTSDGTDATEQAFKTSKSDIDLFFYGLSPQQCTAKALHIEQVIAANLPQQNGQPAFAVVRTASTITFCPADSAYRRVQVVLRVFANPMAVLLDFDLDQVTVGRTQDEVFMLPRCARALITGYTVFTMDLVQGSWMTPRSSTYPSRIFKYAYRGFGLRFLPSYLASLPTVSQQDPTTDDRHPAAERSVRRDELSVTLREERARIRWWLAEQQHKLTPEAQLTFAEAQKAMCESFKGSNDNNLSHGLQHFARQVALMELRHIAGLFADVDQPNVPSAAARRSTAQASTSPARDAKGADGPPPILGQFPTAPTRNEDDEMHTYDNTPVIKWIPEEGLEKLRHAVQTANDVGNQALMVCVTSMFSPEGGWWRWSEEEARYEQRRNECLAHHLPLVRAVYGHSVEEALQHPLISLLYVPKAFQAVAEANLPPAHFRMVEVLKPEYAPLSETWTLRDLEQNANSENLQWVQNLPRVRFPGPQATVSTALGDRAFSLVYFIQDGVNNLGGCSLPATSEPCSSSGPASTANPAHGALANTAPRPKVHFQLASRTQDEICDMVRLLQATHTNFASLLTARNEALRKQLLGWVERPSREEELAEFRDWVCRRAVLTSKGRRESVTGILHAPRDILFRRFQMPRTKMMELMTLRQIPSFWDVRPGENEWSFDADEMHAWFRRRLQVGPLGGPTAG